MKWNESGFMPPLCTYMLNWARRTSWGWWDDWDDTVLQTQDSKFPTILTFTCGWGRNIFCFFQTAETGNRAPNSGVKGSGANHYPRAPALIMSSSVSRSFEIIIILWYINYSIPEVGTVLKRQNLTSKDDPGTERIKQIIMVVHP